MRYLKSETIVTTAHHTDKELYARVQKGDAQAFTDLYNTYYRPLYLTALARLKDQELSRDVVQDVLADIWQKAPARAIDQVEAYLHSAVRYQTIRQLSNKTTHPFFDGAEEMMAAAASTAQPSDQLAYKELLQLVELWIGTLPPKRKEIFLLHYRQHLTTKQIAEQLGLSQKSVQNQLGLAFNDLRDKLPVAAALLMLLAR